MNERTLVETLARMTTSDEMRGGMVCEDEIETMNRLIVEARACVAANRDAQRWPAPNLPLPAPGDAVFFLVVHNDMSADQEHTASGPEHAAACGALLRSLAERMKEDANFAPPAPVVATIGLLAALGALKPETMQ